VSFSSSVALAMDRGLGFSVQMLPGLKPDAFLLPGISALKDGVRGCISSGYNSVIYGGGGVSFSSSVALAMDRGLGFSVQMLPGLKPDAFLLFGILRPKGRSYGSLVCQG